MITAKQKPKISFPFFVGSPPTPRRKSKIKEGKFLFLAPATEGSGRGAHHWSSGFNSKYIRTSSSRYRQNSKSEFPPEMRSRRRRDTGAEFPPNPIPAKIFHAPRGSSFANTNNMNHTRKFFIYTRKSTDTEDRQVRSISDQLAELKELALKEQ